MPTTHECALIFSLALFTTACGASAPAEPPGGSAPEPQGAPQTKNSDPELSVRDRTQASYVTTLVRGADGERYTDGQALIEIFSFEQATRLAMTIRAWNDRSESWSARFELPEQVALGAETAFDLQSRGQVPLVRRAGQSKTPETSRSGSVRLERGTASGKRAFLTGQIVTDSSATSAEFRTEYGVECMVPPEELGQKQNGQLESPTGPAQALVIDERFESEFCKRFSSLR